MMRASFLVVASFAAPAFAQGKPVLVAPAVVVGADTATIAAARELVSVTDAKGMMKAVGPRLADVMKTQMQQQFVDSKVPEGLQVQLTAAAQAFVGSMDTMFTPATLDSIAMIYARHFTAEELKRLTQLLQEPVMVKFRAETPAVMAEMMPVMFEAIKPQQQQFQAKIKQIMIDWIAQHPEDKAKLRSPAAS